MDLLNKITDTMKREPQLLKVLMWPNPLLTTVSDSILSSIPDDQDLQNLLDDMAFTMKSYQAVGLAAVQVGVPVRALVVQENKNSPVFKVINPVITEQDGSSFEKEGCLSVPTIFTKISRPEEVVVTYFNELGELKNTAMNGLLARAITHEIDHLNGIMFLSKMNFVQKSSILKQYKKFKREHENML